MKVCYIISTCNKYLDTRVQYQWDTFLKDVNKEDVFYLTADPDVENRQFGWGCLDDEKNIAWKYIHFVYNMKDILNYDWYCFFDDDTFVFNDRLKKFLLKYDCNKDYYIGCQLDHIRDVCIYASGGAGYAMSNSLYNKVFTHVQNLGEQGAFKHWCDDVCIGIWVKELQEKYNSIEYIHKPNIFLVDHFKEMQQLKTCVMCHKIFTKEENDLCYSIATTKPNIQKKHTTCIAIITDLNYFYRAKRTILDARTIGNWKKDIVLVTIDFSLNDVDEDFKTQFEVIEVSFECIDKQPLLNKIPPNGFSNSDLRELNKLNQWEKLHIFDDYFRQWNKVIFFDAGLRILDDLKYVDAVECKNKLVAPKDGKLFNVQHFECQLSYDNPDEINAFIDEFSNGPVDVLKTEYFLNCMWIYDTSILDICDKQQLIDAMYKYPFCKTNEMGIMNIMFHCKYHLWERLPIYNCNNKILFDWCELNNPGTHWTDYCLIKYSSTLKF
jgi:hypothetical protein